MKKPALFITVLFTSIIVSTILVSTAISGILSSLYKNDNPVSAKVNPAKSNLNKDLKEATVRL